MRIASTIKLTFIVGACLFGLGTTPSSSAQSQSDQLWPGWKFDCDRYANDRVFERSPNGRGWRGKSMVRAAATGYFQKSGNDYRIELILYNSLRCATVDRRTGKTAGCEEPSYSFYVQIASNDELEHSQDGFLLEVSANGAATSWSAATSEPLPSKNFCQSNRDICDAGFKYGTGKLIRSHKLPPEPDIKLSRVLRYRDNNDGGRWKSETLWEDEQILEGVMNKFEPVFRQVCDVDFFDE